MNRVYVSAMTVLVCGFITFLPVAASSTAGDGSGAGQVCDGGASLADASMQSIRIVIEHEAVSRDLSLGDPVAQGGQICAPCYVYPENTSYGKLIHDVCLDFPNPDDCPGAEVALDECLEAGAEAGRNCCTLDVTGAGVCGPRRGGGCCCDWACYCTWC